MKAIVSNPETKKRNIKKNSESLSVNDKRYLYNFLSSIIKANSNKVEISISMSDSRKIISILNKLKG